MSEQKFTLEQIEAMMEMVEWSKEKRARFEQVVEKATPALSSMNPQELQQPTVPVLPMQRKMMQAGFVLGQMQGIAGKEFMGKMYGADALRMLAAMENGEEAISKEPATPYRIFYVRRDEQIKASPARIEIEQHLNSLSQAEIENLAAVLRAGGRIKGIVKAGASDLPEPHEFQAALEAGLE